MSGPACTECGDDTSDVMGDGRADGGVYYCEACDPTGMFEEAMGSSDLEDDDEHDEDDEDDL